MLYQLVRFEQYAQKLETDFLHFCGFTQGTWAESIESYFLIFFFLLVYNDARSLVTFSLLSLLSSPFEHIPVH